MPKVADFIERHREQLTQRFLEEASRLESALGLKPVEVINTTPEYLSTLVAISRQGHRGDPAKTKARLEEMHVGARLRHGYSLDEVTGEYAILGRLISSLWEGLPPEQQPPAEDTQLLFEELQSAMDTAVAVFSGYTLEDRQAEKRALRRLDALAPESLPRTGDPATLRARLTPLVQVIQEALKGDGAELLLADEEGQRLTFAAATGACPPAAEGYALSVAEPSFLARVAASEEVVHLPDALTAPREDVRPEVRHSGLHTLVGLRLWPHGKLMGVLWVGMKEVRSFEPRARRYFETLVEYLSGILDHALLVGELRQKQELLSAVLEHMPAGVFIAEAPSGRLLYGNQQVREMLGHDFLASSDVGAYGEYHAYHPDGRRYSADEYPMARALQKGERVMRELMHYRRENGGQAFLHVSAVPIRDSHGNIVSAVATVGDLTELKRAEAEREDALALLDSVLATAPVGMALIDKELRFARINAALAAMNGISVEGSLGRRVAELIPEVAAATNPLVQRVLDTGEPMLHMPVAGTTPGTGGQQRHWLVSYYPVKDRAGRAFMVGSVVVDVTSLKQAEETQRQAAQFAEQLMGIVSHDLRNPLHTIVLSATALLRPDDLNERQTKAVTRQLVAAERAQRMIRDLLDFTQARLGGGIPIERRPLDLHALVRQTVEEVQAAHPDRELTLETHGGGQGAWDADRLAQVVSNLVGNALAYSAEGSRVHVETRAEDGTLVLTIHNTGRPIPPELLPHLFEPLRRGQPPGAANPSGIGLGLFIVNSIVRAHGGTVDVRSSEAEGTLFTVRLPRHAP